MKPCFKLRIRCAEQDKTWAAVAEEIGRTPAYVSNIVCARTVPDLSDMLGICKSLDIQPENMGEYFCSPEMQRMLVQKIEERKVKR